MSKGHVIPMVFWAVLRRALRAAPGLDFLFAPIRHAESRLYFVGPGRYKICLNVWSVQGVWCEMRGLGRRRRRGLRQGDLSSDRSVRHRLWDWHLCSHWCFV
ncbi:hypothetical protein GQ44DRAFT_707864 [Phaeosphaeriaceae sp. PMI808]|nr:hypothetical protein GQ44DRAFT_707864 [Phaeosphaeriaceae sp. PMI808]